MLGVDHHPPGQWMVKQIKNMITSVPIPEVKHTISSCKVVNLNKASKNNDEAPNYKPRLRERLSIALYPSTSADGV